MKKILLSSDCNGNFQLLFGKVALLNQKNKFDLMFIVGNVCPVEAAQQFSKIVKHQIKVPIPTYFINSSPMSKVFNLAYPEGSEIAPNFHFLGKSGLKNIQGLNICYVNGTSGQSSYSQHDIFAIINQKCLNKKVDILLTNQWAQQITHTGNTTIANFQLQCQKSTLISQLCYHLSPKYHLCASGKTFYRMEPFKNKRGIYTHFINVAQILSSGLKDKYLLAIQTIPEQLNPPEENIVNSVHSPFDPKKYQTSDKKQREQITKNETTFLQGQQKIGYKDSLRMKQSKKQSQQNYINQTSYVFFDAVPFEARHDDIHQFLERWGKVTKLQVFKMQKGGFKSGIAKFSTLEQTKNCIADTGKYSLYQSRIKFKPKNIQQKYRNQDCWFCEKNAKFDKLLLVYRGKYSMVCLDKGPVTQYHLQIIPINHVDTLGKLQAVEVEQIQLIKNQLSKYFTQKQFQTIICQRYMKLSSEISHCLIQFIAVKQQKMLVQRFFQIIHGQRLNFNKVTEEKQWVRKSQHFIKFQINGQTFIKEIHMKDKIEFDFMRKLICELINKPSKINWRSCQREEKQLLKDRNNVQDILKECHMIIQEQ